MNNDRGRGKSPGKLVKPMSEVVLNESGDQGEMGQVQDDQPSTQAV